MRDPSTSAKKISIEGFASVIIWKLKAKVKSPNTTSMFFCAEAGSTLRDNSPIEAPVATAIVLNKVPVNTMDTSYICIIVFRY